MSTNRRFNPPTYYETYSEDEEESGPASASTSQPTRNEPPSKKRRCSHMADATSPQLSSSSRIDGDRPSSRDHNQNSASRSSVPGPSSSAGSREPLPLEASWINAEPVDEFVREIADFILRESKGRSNVEVEAKIGILIDTRTNERLQLPVLSECIVVPNYPGLRFETNMTADQHAHYNRLLNARVQSTMSPSYPYAKVDYSHTKDVDSFHPSSASGSSAKLRVTTDERTGNVRQCVVKERIGNLNIYCPNRKVDYRVSVNVENPAPRPNSPPSHSRRKDRLTYKHQAFRIDLTQVYSSQDPRPQHELEVEFEDSEELMRLAVLREAGVEAGWAYDELVRVFVNNVRVLVRNAL